MALTEPVTAIQYVTDGTGEKTAVLIPWPVWQEMMCAWERMAELIEDREDAAILREWLAQRVAGDTRVTSLETLEQELAADGLLSN